MLASASLVYLSLLHTVLQEIPVFHIPKHKKKLGLKILIIQKIKTI